MLQKELAKRLRARYDTKMDGNGWLEVSSDGIPLCRIKYNGQFLSNADQNLSDEYRSKIADIQDEISTVREYVGLYEHAPQMKADGVSDYRQLAAFGDTVLAATYNEKNGFMFCTWKQNADGDSVFWGDYSPNYEYVKEAFAVRSGLVNKHRLFSENESADLELSAEKALNGGYYYAELLLPAADYEIKDAMQRTRAVGRENTVEVSILECDILPELQDIRLDTFSLDELNFFAKRLASLPNEELPVFYVVTEQIFNDADENPVSIKDLINCTYGLDTVPVAHNVSNLSELGRFAFENELLSDLEGIPESAVPFLNAEQIGRVQQKNDNGVFEGRLYIPTVHYERPEVYDGVTLPEEEPKNAAFLLKVGAYPKSTFSDEDPALHDLCLPADSDELFNVTDKCGEPEINLCFCYEFYSSIPQITSDMFDSMEEIDELNTLAQRIAAMSESEQTKFKAVLNAEDTATLKGALDIAQNLWRYEFTAEPDTADAFFKKYILENTSTEFDSRWLENLLPRNEADKLLGRLGAAVTDYGVISARNGHLFKPVPYDEPEAKELKTQAMTEEKLDVIEVLDRRALFSNGRLMPEQIPEER